MPQDKPDDNIEAQLETLQKLEEEYNTLKLIEIKKKSVMRKLRNSQSYYFSCQYQKLKNNWNEFKQIKNKLLTKGYTSGKSQKKIL